jgi:hypothetical protein
MMWLILWVGLFIWNVSNFFHLLSTPEAFHSNHSVGYLWAIFDLGMVIFCVANIHFHATELFRKTKEPDEE